MINKIGLNSTSRMNSVNFRSQNLKDGNQNPNFRGIGTAILGGIQVCERMPMVNVAVVDMLSAILPRTVVESLTNCFAGFEAFRRESSGLVVNCMIPGVITLGVANAMNNFIMPKGTNMASCWADSKLINKAQEYYSEAQGENKTKEALKGILENMEGVSGKDKVMFKNTLSKEEIEMYSQKLYELTQKSEKDPKVKDELKDLISNVVKKTHVAENVKISGKSDVHATTVGTMLSDSVKFFREYQKVSSHTSIEEFAKRSKDLVRAKSLMGLGIILPLAISMQYINRWITGKVSGVKGAPIYEDFGKGEETIEEKSKSKKGLLKQKLISISSMLGVSLLSMTKRPSMNMLEFKGIFPTMDQARIISTATFCSRMAAADDKNELAESTARDIATFSGLYLLGDYASKWAATIMQKETGVVLLNDTKPLDKNANAFQKAWHWLKDVNVKSTKEVVSNTEMSLKGATPTKEQAKQISKELNKATNMRLACQIANIGVSLVLLGIIIPVVTRRNTKHKHERAMKLAQDNIQTNQAENNNDDIMRKSLNIQSA